jgi:hypothetical protein
MHGNTKIKLKMRVYKIFIEYEATPLMNYKYLIAMKIYAFNCNIKKKLYV